MKTPSTKTSPVACAEWATRLAANHSDDLAPDDRIALKRHVASCANCAAVYAAYQQVDARIRSLPVVQPTVQQVSQLEALITARVTDEPGRQPVGNSREPLALPVRLQQRRRSLPGWLSTLAAVLVVAVLAGSSLVLFSSRHSSTAVGAAGMLYTITYSDGTAYGLKTATGQTVWKTPLHIKPDEAVLISHGVIFITSQDGFLYAVRTSDGQLLWKHSYKSISQNGNRPVISPSLVSDGVAVYLGAETGLYAWRVSDGQQLWFHAPPAGCDQSGITGTCDRYPITASNGIVYVYFDGLYALRATDGATLWHNLRFAPNYDNSMAVIKDRLYVIAPQYNAIDVLQADNGHVLDTTPIPHNNSIQLLAVGNMIYINDGLNDFYAVRSSDNTVLWHRHYAVGGWLVTGGDGNLYYMALVVSTNKAFTPGKIIRPSDLPLHGLSNQSFERLYAINASDGSFHWYWQYPAGTAPGPIETGSGVVYVSANGVYALHASNGKMIWHALPGTWLARLAIE